MQAEELSQYEITFKGRKFTGPKPWLNEDGVRLHPKEIKKLSKKWNEETWFFYLKSVEKGLKENVGRKNDRTILLERFSHSKDGEEASTLEEYYENNEDFHSRNLTDLVAHFA